MKAIPQNNILRGKNNEVSSDRRHRVGASLLGVLTRDYPMVQADTHRVAQEQDDELALEQFHDNQRGTLACLCLVALMVVGMMFQVLALGDTPNDHAAANGGDIQPVRVARVSWGGR